MIYIRRTYCSSRRGLCFLFLQRPFLFTSSRLSSSRARATESNLPINSYLFRPLYALWTTGDTIGNCNWILVFTFKSILAALCSHPHVPLSVYASPIPSVPPLSVADLSPSLSQYNVTTSGYAVSICNEWRCLKTTKRFNPRQSL